MANKLEFWFDFFLNEVENFLSKGVTVVTWNIPEAPGKFALRRDDIARGAALDHPTGLKYYYVSIE